MEGKIVVKVELEGEELQKFLALKKHYGVKNNTELLRILVNKTYEKIDREA